MRTAVGVLVLLAAIGCNGFVEAGGSGSARTSQSGGDAGIGSDGTSGRGSGVAARGAGGSGSKGTADGGTSPAGGSGNGGVSGTGASGNGPDGDSDGGTGGSAITYPPAQGFTELPDLPAGARNVYVSAEGDDGDDGLTPEHAKLTFAAGYALIRDGVGDRLLLRRGDGFDVPDRPFLWEQSGASASAPAVLGAYGQGPRPILRSGDESALQLTAGYHAGHSLAHVMVMDLDIMAEKRDPSSPSFDSSSNTGPTAIVIGASDIQASVEAEDVLIEGCRIQWFAFGINPQGDLTMHPNIDIRIRRNVLSNIYCGSTANCSNAIYAEGTKGLLIEENLIDSMMLGQVPGAVPSDMNHSIYGQSDTTDVVVRGNIFARVPDAGMLRGGGEYSGNLAIRAGIGLTAGFIFGGATPVTGGVSITVTGNAFVDASDISPGLPRGTGLIVGNIQSGVISDNILMHDARGNPTTGVAISFHGEMTQVDGVTQVGVHDLTVQDNQVYDWPGLMDSNDGSYDNVMVTGNSFQMTSDDGSAPLSLASLSGFTFSSNTWYSPRNSPFEVGSTSMSFSQWSQQPGVNGGGDTQEQQTFADPTRSPESYDTSIGGDGTLDDFLANAREQSRDQWLPQYTAAPVIEYLKDGLKP